MTRSPRRTHPLAALVAAGVLALVALAGLSAVAAAPASAGPYVNPSPADIRAKLNAAAVAHGIPPRILYAIAYQESTWRQFDANGDPLISNDGNGIGIMQVTTVPAGVDVARLETDIDYNIGVGADILVTKWGYAPSVFAGDRRREPALLRGLVLRGVGVQRPEGGQPVSVPDLGPHQGRPRSLDRSCRDPGAGGMAGERPPAEDGTCRDAAARALVESHAAAQARC